MFIDRMQVTLSGGRGGNGLVAWTRKKYIPKGGPCGGNGGPGGSVFIQADSNLVSFDRYRNKKIFKAQNGKPGGPHQQQGAKGADQILLVPLGTIVRHAETSAILYDFTDHGESYLICHGGKGGLGNTFFKSATNQAPNFATEGKEGESIQAIFELKLLADVGLIGMPNAGKSTLFSQLTSHYVEQASYPFTTLQPNISYIENKRSERILIADIPGIIEYAHKNKGLGFSFLQHIERSSILLFILDTSKVDNSSPIRDFEILQQELLAYNKEIVEKPFAVILNKIDHPDSSLEVEQFKKKYAGKFPILTTSALLGTGIDRVREHIIDTMDKFGQSRD